MGSSFAKCASDGVDRLKCPLAQKWQGRSGRATQKRSSWLEKLAVSVNASQIHLIEVLINGSLCCSRQPQLGRNAPASRPFPPSTSKPLKPCTRKSKLIKLDVRLRTAHLRALSPMSVESDAGASPSHQLARTQALRSTCGVSVQLGLQKTSTARVSK